VKRLVALIVAVLAAAPTGAEELQIPEPVYPLLARTAETVEGFVAEGWRIEARTDGDLDGDGRADVALVMRATDPASILSPEMCEERLDANARIVAVALARPGVGYELAGDSLDLIPRRENPCAVEHFASPEQMTIEGGVLRIEMERLMSMGSWAAGMTAYRFRLQDGQMLLIGFDYSYLRRNTGDISSLSINYLTGRAKIVVGRIDSEREQVRWVSLHDRRLRRMDEIGDGLMFDPEDLVSNLP
jgi:hypothetical protein